MSDPLIVQSHRGAYNVSFDDGALERLNSTPLPNGHFVIDSRVAELHADTLSRVCAAPSVLRVTATEAAKSLDKMEGYIEHMVACKVRRSDVLVAVGGGVVQDITCFLASTLLRGIEWHFYPTTLLAQADSCIGSKSSINVGQRKNLLGTFYPPTRIHVATRLLRTLDERDVRSGVGEMLKVHAIDGPRSFDIIARDYTRLFAEPEVMAHYIRRSLELKKVVVELDEFDRGPRNVMNYGHSFGHAIESATDFAVPHGIAVTLGMDLANYVAFRMGRMPQEHFVRMHKTLAANYRGFEQTEVPLPRFFDALDKDKKNTRNALRLVLPNREARVDLASCANDDAFREYCTYYLLHERR